MSEKQINTNIDISNKQEIVVSPSSETSKENSISAEVESQVTKEFRLGNYLKNLRERNDVSLKQLSIDTKINESVLVNLEIENFAELPRKIYLTGFIKTYTQYFKTTPNKALDLLESVFQQDAPTTDVEGRFENHQGTQINPNSIIKAIMAIFFLLVLSYAIKKFFFSPKVEVINPEITTEKISSNTPLVGSPSNIELSQESSELKQKATEVFEEKKSESAPEKKTTQTDEKKETGEEGDQLPTEISFKKFPEGYLSYLSTNLNDIKEFVPESILSPNSGVSEKIIISANDDKTWLAYQKDDEEIKQLILKEGKVLVISGNEVRLVIGNSNSIRLIHNQKEVDIKSKTGIKSLVFPQSVASKYQLPLFYQNSEGEYVSSGQAE